MTDHGKPAPQPAHETISCRRLDRLHTVEEHLACPYCFGRAADVKPGEHSAFCDFEPGQDPVHFGFPPDSKRNSSA